jgi:anti-sigma B factor antagonist
VSSLTAENLIQRKIVVEKIMKLIEGIAEDVTVLEAHGRVDGSTAKEFCDRLITVINSGSRRVVIDFKNLAYISSAGLRALLLADRAAAQKQGKLVLCGISGDVRRLFEIGAFLDVFMICSSQQDAIGRLRQA